MGERLDTGFCPVCDQQRLIRQSQPNHILHLLLSVFTFGLWVIVWIIVASRTQPARCTHCGTLMRRLFDAQRGGTYWAADVPKP